MCLINFAVQKHEKYKLVVAANRDEFLERPTAAADYWQDNRSVLAGRDLQAMGTWLGITRSGRFAALTNYRNPAESKEGKLSRGDIVRNYLEDDQSAFEYLQAIQQQQDNFQGFNVLVGSADELYYFSNYQGDIKKIEVGYHSLSNALLNTPWPKVLDGRRALEACLRQFEKSGTQSELENCLFAMLGNRKLAKDEDLPATGVPLEWERALSASFIEREDYGTRASTILLVDHDNHVHFVERSFHKGVTTGQQRFSFHY